MADSDIGPDAAPAWVLNNIMKHTYIILTPLNLTFI